MADSIYKILIQFGLEDNKAKEAADQIEGLNAATRQSASGTKEASKATEDASNATEKHTGHIHGLHRAIGLLGRQFGEFGHLAHFAFNLPTLAIAALAISIHKLAEVSKAAEEKILKAAEATAAVLEEKRKLASDAIEAEQRYKEALDETAKSTDSLKEKEAARLKILQAIHDEQLKIIKAQEDAEIKAAGGDKVREEEIKRRFGHKTTAEDSAHEAAVIAEKERNLETAKREADEAALKRASAHKATMAHMSHGPDKKTLEQMQKDEAEQTAPLKVAKDNALMQPGPLPHMDGPIKSLLQLKAEADAAAEDFKKTGMFGGMSDERNARDRTALAYERAKKASDALEENQNKLGFYSREIAKIEARDTRLRETEEKAKADAKVKADDVQERNRDLIESRKIQTIHKDTVVQVDRTQDFSRAPEIIEAGTAAIFARAHGQKISEDQQHAIAEYQQLLKELGWNFQSVAAFVASSKDLHKTSVDAIKAANAEIQQLNAQMKQVLGRETARAGAPR